MMYKIGDRVRVIDNTGNDEWYDVGAEGTVSTWAGMEPDGFGAWVQFDHAKSGDGLWYVANVLMEKI